MGLKTFVKVGGVTNLSDARYCAGMGVDQIGFCVNPSNPNYVSNETINEITGWISGIEIISELDDFNTEVSTAIIETNSTNIGNYGDKKIVIQLPIDDAEKEVDQLKSLNNLEYIILTGDMEIDTTVINRINQLTQNLPVVVGFGIRQDNVNQLIEQTGIKGISLLGGSEIRPGFKDYDELADILEAIEED